MNDEFICPACGLKLREVRMERGVFWACAQCGGRALSVELLRRTFTAASINPFWLRTISGAGRIGRNCPIHAMLEVALSEDAGARRSMSAGVAILFGSTRAKSLRPPREIPGPEPSFPKRGKRVPSSRCKESRGRPMVGRLMASRLMSGGNNLFASLERGSDSPRMAAENRLSFDRPRLFSQPDVSGNAAPADLSTWPTAEATGPTSE